jgi:hypothetical protein
MSKRTSLLFFAHAAGATKKGGVSDAIYRGGVKSGIPAG